MAVLAMGIVGICVLVCEIYVLMRLHSRYIGVSKVRTVACWTMGAAASIASLFFMYPLSSTVWVVGIPFPTSAFEWAGEGWVGFVSPIMFLTFPLNGIIWLMLPQLAMVAWLKIRSRRV